MITPRCFIGDQVTVPVDNKLETGVVTALKPFRDANGVMTAWLYTVALEKADVTLEDLDDSKVSVVNTFQRNYVRRL